MFSAP